MVKACEKIKKGTDVTVGYGNPNDFNNLRTFLAYGFIEYPTDHDQLSITISLDENDHCFNDKLNELGRTKWNFEAQ